MFEEDHVLLAHHLEQACFAGLELPDEPAVATMEQTLVDIHLPCTKLQAS